MPGRSSVRLLLSLECPDKRQASESVCFFILILILELNRRLHAVRRRPAGLCSRGNVRTCIFPQHGCI